MESSVALMPRPESSDPANRRRHERHEVAFPVTVEHAGWIVSGVTRNLSFGGMFISLEVEIPFGATVKVQLHLPTQGQAISTTATVRWVQVGEGIGVQFAGLRARDVFTLQQLLTGTQCR